MIGDQLTGIVTKRGPRKFTAKCLELEIDCEGASADEAKNRLIDAVQKHIDILLETREQGASTAPRKFVYPAVQKYQPSYEESIVFEMPNHLILH